LGLAPCVSKKRVSDIDKQSESNIAKEALDNADPSFFGTSDEKKETTAKKSVK
jgi:hypothetical protein